MLSLCVGLGLLIGVSGYTFYYAEGGAYLSNDPKGCANCHVMRDVYDSWQKASHHGVATCNDCHTPHDFLGKWTSKAVNGFWHSKGFTLQDFPEPIRITPKNRRVLENNCRHCHAELVHDITHADPESGGCVRCHASVGHGPPR
jgi:cytochrome c nitrite reductase small subunit